MLIKFCISQVDSLTITTYFTSWLHLCILLVSRSEIQARKYLAKRNWNSDKSIRTIRRSSNNRKKIIVGKRKEREREKRRKKKLPRHSLIPLFHQYFVTRREHPDEQPPKEEFDEWFETDNQRELRQIFSGQSQMFDALRELNRKLDEVVGRQERTLSLIAQVQVGGEKKNQRSFTTVLLIVRILRCSRNRGSPGRSTDSIDRHDKKTGGGRGP